MRRGRISVRHGALAVLQSFVNLSLSRPCVPGILNAGKEVKRKGKA